MAVNFPMGQNFPMKDRQLDAFVRGLQIIMEVEHIDMKPLSLAAGMGESAVRDLFRYKSSPKVSTAHEYAKVVGRSIDEIIAIGTQGNIDAGTSRSRIAVAGHVGAGAMVELVDAYAKGGGLYQVACPPQIAPTGVVAVEVRGDSMEPIYSESDVLFYTRNSHEGIVTEDVGRKCVVADRDSRVWVKQVQRGSAPGLFHLVSINPGAQTVWDAPILWAARVRFHLPADLVQRI